MTLFAALLFMILGAYFAGMCGYATAVRAHREDLPVTRTTTLWAGIGLVTCGTAAMSGLVVVATLVTAAWGGLSFWASRPRRS